MNDLLLSKPILPEGWVDCSVGEPHIIRDALINAFDCSKFEIQFTPETFQYPPPQGYRPLVDLLEHKHGAPVVITNGAKQAIGACFYALKQMGWNYCAMRDPYWALIPPLAKMHDIEMSMNSGPHIDDGSPFLLLSPNNPDGIMPAADHMIETCKQFASREKSALPFIHDAAYYTYSYVPRELPLPILGDVQIYSLSKMLGLSGLRVGYAVCPNKEFHKLIKQYMEAMTVGVSLPSQMFAYDLMNQMRGYPTIVEKFENIAYASLEESKKIIKQVNPEILEVPDDIVGMFGWFKVGARADFQKAKVNTIDGALFGKPGYIRMNLAFKPDIIHDIVKRLNESIIVE